MQIFWKIGLICFVIAGCCGYIGMGYQHFSGKKWEDNEKLTTILGIPMMICTLIAFLAGLSWIWYWLCGGFLVFSDSGGFWSSLLASLTVFAVVIGPIIIWLLIKFK